MVWSQVICGSSLFLFGGICLLLSAQALIGNELPEWLERVRMVLEASATGGSDPRMLIGIMGISVGTITLLGGLGLIIVSLL
jgi:hypothetical protein